MDTADSHTYQDGCFESHKEARYAAGAFMIVIHGHLRFHYVLFSNGDTVGGARDLSTW